MAPARKASSAENRENKKPKKKVKRLKKNSIQTFFTSTTGGHNLKLNENIYKCLNVENTKNKSSQQKPNENKQIKPPPLIVTDNQSSIDVEWYRKIQLQKYVHRHQSVSGQRQ